MTTESTIQLREVGGIDAGRIWFEPDNAVIAPGSRWAVRCWLDGDGTHVWCAHDCVEGRVITMLPWPTWQALPDSRVLPSFSCGACGVHTFTGISYEKVA
jgi:hypothetical protein